MKTVALTAAPKQTGAVPEHRPNRATRRALAAQQRAGAALATRTRRRRVHGFTEGPILHRVFVEEGGAE
jgi:hypothetical protein